MQYLTQAFPKSGALAKNLDWNISKLSERIANISGEVYSYVMTSIMLDRDADQLQQTGSGPNFQGGYITLCTCKHRMRANLPVEQWPNKWVADFTSLCCGGKHWLFYLERVKCAYESHHELWNELSAEVRGKKSASDHALGDLYEPKNSDCSQRFNPAYYVTPVSGHSHRQHSCDNCWRGDIDYRRTKKGVRRPKRPSALLVGDPRLSFLWRKPMIYSDGRWRTKKWASVGDFLECLLEGSSQKVAASKVRPVVACRT